MTKRRLIRWSLLVFTLAAFAVWLEPTRVVWGWLRGEAFYQGRPTSFWSREIKQWRPGPGTIAVSKEGSFVSNSQSYGRKPTSFEQFLSRFMTLPAGSWPTLLDGDPDAELVLRELLNDRDEDARNWADEGLKRRKSKDRGPYKTTSFLK